MAVWRKQTERRKVSSRKMLCVVYAIGMHLVFLGLTLVPFSQPRDLFSVQHVILIDTTAVPAVILQTNTEMVSSTIPPTPLKTRPAPPREDPARHDREIAENVGLVRLLKRSRADESGIRPLSSAPDAPLSSSNAPPEENRLIGAKGRPSRGIQPVARTERSAVNIAMAGRRAVTIENPLKMDPGGTTVGGRSIEEMKKVLDEGKGAIEILYRQARADNSSLQGTVTLEFLIASDGSVPTCRVVASTLNHPSFEDALVRRIRHLKFQPIPNGDITVTFPFVFYPGT